MKFDGPVARDEGPPDAGQTKEAMPSVYRVSVTLNRGEYLFFILGSGDDKKGILGKGYDFGID